MSEERQPLPDLSRLPAITRRRVLQMLGTGGAALAAAPILSACGGSSKSSSSGTTIAASGQGAAPSSATAGAGSVADIATLIGPIDAAHAAKGVSYPMSSVLALSGPGSFYGGVMSKGVNLAVKHIAALGGPNLQVKYYDHKSGDPTAGANAIQQIGLAHNPVTLSSYAGDLGSMFAGMAQYQVMSIDGGGGTGLFGNSKPFFWGTRANTPVDPFPGVVMYIKQKMPSVKKITFVVWNLGSENAPINADWKQQLQKGGLTPGAIVLTTVGATDYSTVIQQVKNDNPDMIFLSIYGLDPGYFMKQYQTSGIGKPLIGFEFTPDAAKVAGSAYDGYTYAFDYFDTDNPPNDWSKIFLAEWEKEYGGFADLDFYGANYYEDTFLVWDLIRRVSASGGDINSGAALQSALVANPTFKSVYGGSGSTVGEVQLDTSLHTPIRRPMGLFQYKSGKSAALAFFNENGANFTLA